MKCGRTYELFVALSVVIGLITIGVNTNGDVTTNEAIKIAARACDGKIQINTNEAPLVTTTNGLITVCFASTVPTNALGPGFAAEVTVDTKTGKVLQLLAGPD